MLSSSLYEYRVLSQRGAPQCSGSLGRVGSSLRSRPSPTKIPRVCVESRAIASSTTHLRRPGPGRDHSHSIRVQNKPQGEPITIPSGGAARWDKNGACAGATTAAGQEHGARHGSHPAILKPPLPHSLRAPTPRVSSLPTLSRNRGASAGRGRELGKRRMTIVHIRFILNIRHTILPPLPQPATVPPCSPQPSSGCRGALNGNRSSAQV